MSDIRAGDYVEFLSDKQTEKGPSSGTVRISCGNQLLISHSDVKEEFNALDLDIVSKAKHKNGGVLWQLA